MDEPLGLKTDHYPTIIEIPAVNVENKTVVVNYRKLKDIDLTSFKQDLEEAINSIDTDNINFAEHHKAFHEKSKNVLDTHAPVQTWKQKGGGPAWMDGEYKKSRILRRKLEKMWRKDRTEENSFATLNKVFLTFPCIFQHL